MKYSSPQALLNKYFKGRKKFNNELGDKTTYENKNWILIHIEGEEFDLIEKRYCNEIGHYDHEHGTGQLIDLINKIREMEGKI